MKSYSYAIIVVFGLYTTGTAMGLTRVNFGNVNGTHYWTDRLNWTVEGQGTPPAVYPGPNNDAGIIGQGSNYCLIDSSMNITIGKVRVGVVNNNACELRITGGTLHDTNDMFIGMWAGCNGSFVNQTGGNVVVDANLNIGNTSDGCRYYLTGGTLTVNGHITTDWLDPNTYTTKSRLNITYGTLVVPGDQTTAIQQLVDANSIVGFDTPGNVVISIVGGNTHVTANPTLQAYNPSPFNGDTNVDLTTFSYLSWSSGVGAVTHDVYLGTDYNDVNDADRNSTGIYQGLVGSTSYAPSSLNCGATYYWRIDEINGVGGVVKGGVWTFSTRHMILGWVNWDLNQDWNDPNNWNNATFPALTATMIPDANTDVTVVWGGANGPRIVSDTNAVCWRLTIGIVSNPASTVTVAAGGALRSRTDIVIGKWPGCEGSFLTVGGGSNVYVGGDVFVGQLSDYCSLRIYDANVTIRGTLRFYDSNDNVWMADGARLVLFGDQVSKVNSWINQGEIRGDTYVELAADGNTVVTTHYLGDPNRAWGPYPAHGETLRGSGYTSLKLRWLRRNNATNWNVYFGTDFNDVNDATTDTAGIYKGNVPNPNYRHDPNYVINGLNYGSTYYWRIDAIANSVVTKGSVWAFRIVEQVDWNEVRMLSEQWLNEDCSKDNVWCYSADYDHNGKVEFDDFARMAVNWVNVP